MSRVCFSSLEGGRREEREQRREEKDEELQDGLRLEKTAHERSVEISGGSGGCQRPL